MKVIWGETEDYLKLKGETIGNGGAWYQLAYDRLYERVVDNSKVRRVTGLTQEDFMSLRSGLEKELKALPKNIWSEPTPVWEKMDAYIKDQ